MLKSSFLFNCLVVLFSVSPCFVVSRECSTNTCVAASTTGNVTNFKLTCGVKTQQIVLGVVARLYSSSNNGTGCNATGFEDVSEDPNICEVGEYLGDKCDKMVDCEFDVADLLLQCDKSSFTATNIEVSLDCGDPGTDPLTMMILLMLFFVSLAMGATTSMDDFRHIMKSKKKSFSYWVCITVWIYAALFLRRSFGYEF